MVISKGKAQGVRTSGEHRQGIKPAANSCPLKLQCQRSVLKSTTAEIRFLQQPDLENMVGQRGWRRSRWSKRDSRESLRCSNSKSPWRPWQQEAGRVQRPSRREAGSLGRWRHEAGRSLGRWWREADRRREQINHMLGATPGNLRAAPQTADGGKVQLDGSVRRRHRGWEGQERDRTGEEDGGGAWWRRRLGLGGDFG